MELLIVDDSATMRQMVLALLRDQGVLDGPTAVLHAVREASNGLAALGEIASKVPDLIITDLSMPLLDGTKMLWSLRQTHPRSEVKVIVLTSKASRPVAETLASLDVEAVLPKPCDPAELAAVVRRALS